MLRHKQEKVIIISAPSGAGKSTIARFLLSADLNLEFSVSATSRPIRPGETEGKEYYFISTEEFKKKINKGELLEWQEVYLGSFYGTLKTEMKRIHESGKVPVFDVDVVGGLNIKKMYGDKALALFIQPPSLEVLEQRLRSRGTDSEESLRNRLEKIRWELEFASGFDKIIINDLLENARAQSEQVVREFLFKSEE